MVPRYRYVIGDSDVSIVFTAQPKFVLLRKRNEVVDLVVAAAFI